jgi:hypothetical protein
VLFDGHWLTPETFRLESGAVEVRRFTWCFPRWLGGPPKKHSLGPKPLVNCAGVGVFAELAILPVLRQYGFDGAVWVDNYRRCFRDAMPPAVCKLPERMGVLHERIVTANGGRRGCWDVLAWNRYGVLFVECKFGADSIKPSQVKWLESSIRVGLHPENFAICDWSYSESGSFGGLPPP